MITRCDIPPGSLVRSKHGSFRRREIVGILIAFDHFGRVNPDKGDPLVLWAGEAKPVRMVGSSLEIVP
jgi:hypothetical protein